MSEYMRTPGCLPAAAGAATKVLMEPTPGACTLTCSLLIFIGDPLSRLHFLKAWHEPEFESNGNLPQVMTSLELRASADDATSEFRVGQRARCGMNMIYRCADGGARIRGWHLLLSNKNILPVTYL
jgi:hypothetical protein